MKKIAVLFTLLISVISLSAQTSRTWTGSTSTDWNTAANWSPSGVPSSSDHIILNTSSGNQPLLDANRSITNITVTAGAMNLNGYTLTATGTTSLTGGQINSGVMQFSNTTTAIAGTTFGAAVNISSGAVTITSSVFNSAVSIAKSGSSADSWTGGNTFNSTLDISLSNGSIDLVNYLTGNTYNDNITVNNTGSGRIRFNAYTNTSTLASGKTIAVGSSGYSSGTLTINGITISGSTAQSFTLTGTSTLNLANIIFGGTVSISSPNFNLGYSTFNGAVSVTKNGSGTASWEAGNTFNSTLDVNVSGGNLNLNSWTNANTFNDNVTISNTGSGTVKLSSYSNTNYLASGKTISVGSGGFASGNLYINNVSQTGTTAQNFTVTGSAGLFIETSTWGGNITATGPSVNLNGGTYNGTVIINKNGSATAGWGGCTFNSTLDVNVSSGSMNLTSWTSGNNYNDNVTVSNTGSGTINFNSYGANSYLASGKTITVGSGGFATGTLTISGITQSGTTAQNFTVTGTAALNIASSTWGGAITATGPSVTINGGSTFNGALTVYKNGSAANGWAGTGVNTFNSTLDINVSSGNLDLASWAYSNNYNGNVTISNTGGGTIRFNAYTNTSTLASGKTISIGTGGFAGGNLYINGITQSGSTAQNITLTGTTTTLYLTNSTFNGAITASAPNVISGGSTFNSDFTVTKSSSSTNSWTANTYNGNVSITNTGTGYINTSVVASGGDVYNANATFTKSGSGDVIIAGNGSTVTFKGDVTLNNISSTQFTGSQVALFTGTNTQTLSQSGGSFNFGRVTINKASNYVTLSSPLTVSTALTLTSGKVLTSSTNILNLADNSTVSGASNNSYVEGPMKKTGNDAFTFPIGKSNYYRPIGIAAPTSTATVFTAEYHDANQTLGSIADTSIANLSDCEYWTLTRSGSSDNVNVTLSWNSNSCNGAIAINMLVAGWNGSQWTNYGNSARTGTATAGTITSGTTPTAFDVFTLSNKTCSYSASITPSGSTTACYGSLTLTANSSKFYTWNNYYDTQSIIPDSTGSYSVAVRDTNGCKGLATLAVTIHPAPITDARDITILTSTTSKIGGYPTVISGTPPFTYVWSPSTALDSTTVANPTTSTTTQRNYYLQVTDSLGCVALDTVNVGIISGIIIPSDSIYEGSETVFEVSYSGANKSLLYFMFPNGENNNNCNGYNYAIPDSIGKGGSFSAQFSCRTRMPGTYSIELYVDKGQQFPQLITSGNFTVHPLPSHLKPVDHIFKPNEFVVGMFDFQYFQLKNQDFTYNDSTVFANQNLAYFNVNMNNGSPSSSLNVLKSHGFNLIQDYSYPSTWAYQPELRSIVELVQKNNMKFMSECSYNFYKPDYAFTKDCNIPGVAGYNGTVYGDSTPSGVNTYENGEDIGMPGCGGQFWGGAQSHPSHKWNFDMVFNPLTSIPDNIPYLGLKNIVWGHKLSEEPNYYHPMKSDNTVCHNMYPDCNISTSPAYPPLVLTEVPPTNLSDAMDYFKNKATGTKQKISSMIALHGAMMKDILPYYVPKEDGIYNQTDYYSIFDKTDPRDVIIEGSYDGVNRGGAWSTHIYNNMITSDSLYRHYLSKFKNVSYLYKYVPEVHSNLGATASRDGSNPLLWEFNGNYSTDNANWMWFKAYNSIIHGAKGIWFWHLDGMYDDKQNTDRKNKAIYYGRDSWTSTLNYTFPLSPSQTDFRFTEDKFPILYKKHLKYLTQEFKYLIESNLLSSDNATVVAQKLDEADPYCIVPNPVLYTKTSTPNYWEHVTENYGLRYTIRTNGTDIIMIITNPLNFSRDSVTLDFTNIPNKLIQGAKGVNILFESSVNQGNTSQGFNGVEYKVGRSNSFNGPTSSYYKAFASKKVTLTFGPLDTHVLKFVADETAPSEPDYNNGWINGWSNYGSGKVGDFGKINDGTQFVVGNFTGDDRDELFCTDANGSEGLEMMLNYGDITNSNSYNFEPIWSNDRKGSSIVSSVPVPLVTENSWIFSGNFTGSSSSYDEILVINDTDTRLFQYSSGTWNLLLSTTDLTTNCACKIYPLDYNSDSNKNTDLVVASYFPAPLPSGIQILTYNSSTAHWDNVWNSTTLTFNGTWSLGQYDNYMQGDLDGDGYKNELFGYRGGSTGAVVLRFNTVTNTWTTLLTDGSFSTLSSDKILVENIDTDGKDEMVRIQRNTSTGYATTYDLNTSTSTITERWTNGNSPSYIDNWNVTLPSGAATTDYLTLRNYTSSSRNDLLAFRKAGCSWNAEIFYINNFGNNYRLLPPDDDRKDFDFNLYPNPSNNELYVNLDISADVKVTITIIDITGRKLYTSQANSKINQLDVSNLPQGLYFVKVENNNYISKTKRVAIVR